MSSPESGDKHNLQTTFHTAARESLQQLRIAGIAVAVAMCGFMVERLNGPDGHKVASLSVITSAMAVVSGFLAWKMASRMFYAKAERLKSEEEFAHHWKNIADTALWILLSLAAGLAAVYVIAFNV